MINDILAQPHQIGDALWRVEAAAVPARRASGGLVVCGMGGSAIGADLAAGAIGTRATAPIRTARGYELGPGVGPDTDVLCASYSGSTEETLACFEAAGAAGARRIALTTGGPLAERAREEDVPVIGVPSGMQPRAAVIYMTVGALECAARCGAAPALRDEIEGAVEVLQAVAADDDFHRIAGALEGTLPVVHGAGPSAAVARRWKTQINENAKMASFASEIPEANHNEIEGWGSALDLAPLSAVFLKAPQTDPRLERRLELTSETLDGMGVTAVDVQAQGGSPIAHILSLVMIGDLVSVDLAERAGVEVEPVPAIEGFKKALG